MCICTTSRILSSIQQTIYYGTRLSAGLRLNVIEVFHIFEMKSYSDTWCLLYKGADKSLARPTSRCILFDGEKISFDASLFLYL
jgi:hypothetical protein